VSKSRGDTVVDCKKKKKKRFPYTVFCLMFQYKYLNIEEHLLEKKNISKFYGKTRLYFLPR